MKPFKCIFGFHNWVVSKLTALGFNGRTFVCTRCGKILEVE